MLTKIKNRFLRAWGFSLIVILLAAVLSGTLCGLPAANAAAQRQYELIRKNTPIKVSVTNLSATNRDNLEIPDLFYKVFTAKYMDNDFVPYVKDVQAKASIPEAVIRLEDSYSCKLVGITDLEISGVLLQGSTSLVTWLEGYDAGVLRGREKYCIIPAAWIPQGTDLSRPLQVLCEYSYTDFAPPGAPFTNTSCELFTVVGVHAAADDLAFCPLRACQSACESVRKPYELDSLQGTLIDNDMLEEFREVSKAWFAEPNSTGEKTPWNYSWYRYYLHALDIDNDQVVSAERTLKLSIMTNEICAWLIFILSACASFFVGFLIIRSRKNEITLMRTLGTPVWKILVEFSAEQLLCMAAGVLLGGAVFLWQPLDRIALFAAVYALGLLLAMAIFLNTNLLTNLKEAE